MVFEMFTTWKNSRSSDGFLALKLYMEKAYKRIEWDFLEVVLVRIQIEVGLIVQWIVSARFNFILFSD